MVPALQRKGPGEGGGEKEPHDDVAGGGLKDTREAWAREANEALERGAGRNGWITGA